jgi:hypothetical protein
MEFSVLAARGAGIPAVALISHRDGGAGVAETIIDDY